MNQINDKGDMCIVSRSVLFSPGDSNYRYNHESYSGVDQNYHTKTL